MLHGSHPAEGRGGVCAPSSPHRHGSSPLFLAPGLAPPSRVRGGPAPPCLEAVKLRGERHIGVVGKKWLAPDRLNPDQQGIWSAALSASRRLRRRTERRIVL